MAWYDLFNPSTWVGDAPSTRGEFKPAPDEERLAAGNLTAAEERAMVTAREAASAGYSPLSLASMGSSRSSRVQGGTGLETSLERELARQKSYAYGADPREANRAVDRSRQLAGEWAMPMGGLGAYSTNQMGVVQSRATPRTDYRAASGSRQGQADAYAALMRAGLAPEGPSAAQAQLNTGTNQALQSQLALARSGRGMGQSASALRRASSNSALIQGEAANQAAILRAQEDAAFRDRQLRAFGAAGGLAGEIRGADVGQAQYLTDAELRARALNDQAALGYGQLGLGAYKGGAETAMGGEELANRIRELELRGSMGYEENLTTLTGIETGQLKAADALAAQREAGLINAGGSLLAAGISASDIRAKENIRPLAELRGIRNPWTGRLLAEPGKEDFARARQYGSGLETPATEAVREAPGYRYRYNKDAQEWFGEDANEHFGPMAQDLEQTPAGRSTVVEGPGGVKMVDTGKLALVNTAAQNETVQRQDTLEARIQQLEAMINAQREPVANPRVRPSDARSKQQIERLTSERDQWRDKAQGIVGEKHDVAIQRTPVQIPQGWTEEELRRWNEQRTDPAFMYGPASKRRVRVEVSPEGAREVPRDVRASREGAFELPNASGEYERPGTADEERRRQRLAMLSDRRMKRVGSAY